MDIIIKESAANTNDSIVISKLAEEIWTEHYSGIIGERQVNYMLAKFQSKEAIDKQISADGYRYFVAYAPSPGESESVAYAAFVLCPNNELFLSKLYVKKEFRGFGFAGKLIDHAVNVYDLTGKFSIYLTVNKNNIVSVAAYQKLGFEITDSILADIGDSFVMDDYKMTKFFGGDA